MMLIKYFQALLLADLWAIIVSMDCVHIHRPNVESLFGITDVEWVCEKPTDNHPGVLASLMDRKSRIPLTSGTVITRAQFEQAVQSINPGRTKNVCWKAGSCKNRNSQASCKYDYRFLDKRFPCYERHNDQGKLYTDFLWTRIDPAVQCSSKEQVQNMQLDKREMTRGHLIADSYILDKDEKKETYRFTNAVPQFGASNGGWWASAERALMLHPGTKDGKATYAWKECFKHPTVINHVNNDPDTHVDLHIVVGVVPSEIPSHTEGSFELYFNPFGNETDGKVMVEPRWMGPNGFGDADVQAGIDFQTFGAVKSQTKFHNYRVNVPVALWTGACCVVSNDKGEIQFEAHTGFAGLNTPSLQTLDQPSVEEKRERSRLTHIWYDDINKLLSQDGLFKYMNVGGTVDVFGAGRCSNPDDYKPFKNKCDEEIEGVAETKECLSQKLTLQENFNEELKVACDPSPAKETGPRDVIQKDKEERRSSLRDGVEGRAGREELRDRAGRSNFI